MLSLGILGGTGYTGKYLLKFLSKHPDVKDFTIYSKNSAGENIYNIFPELANEIKNQIVASVDDLSLQHDFYYSALPHGVAQNYIPSICSANKPVVDLSGDYRLDSTALYEKHYGTTHNSAALLKSKVYGLAEWTENYDNIKLVSNPGCYPTAILLATLPVVKNLAGEIITLSSTAYSGTSGAGKSTNPNLMFTEMFGNFKAYNVLNHRHEAEIHQELQKHGFNSPYSFTSHLLPISQGMYSTNIFYLNNEVTIDQIMEMFNEIYKYSPFVRVRKTTPEISWVVNTNFCDIGVHVRGNSVITTSAIDNLIKGASGQAVQNMNKWLKFDEKLSLWN